MHKEVGATQSMCHAHPSVHAWQTKKIWTQLSNMNSSDFLPETEGKRDRKTARKRCPRQAAIAPSIASRGRVILKWQGKWCRSTCLFFSNSPFTFMCSNLKLIAFVKGLLFVTFLLQHVQCCSRNSWCCILHFMHASCATLWRLERLPAADVFIPGNNSFLFSIHNVTFLFSAT